ncbi:MAG TPA: prepilin-type N-terminal cleavage/methylation domain-containing protein [Thermoanaerobaculia bacterium]
MQRRSSERGFTLSEILVAVAIFAVIFVAALAMYDRSNRTFKEGVERSDMQQNVRVGFDKLVADLRLAGFDYDRDGFPTGSGTGTVWQRNKAYGLNNVVTPITANGYTYIVTTPGTSGNTEPPWNTTLGGTTADNDVRWQTQAGMNQYQQTDEQIEYAHQRAITIRGNFDFETDSASGNGREAALQSAQFPVVTTGNDEIVTYALRSVSGPNPDAIELYADVPDRRTYPGGRAENLVRIPNVNLCTGGCNNPPYTLFRFTLDPEDGTVVESPVAANIRSIEFNYYPDTIGTATALTFTAAATNTAGTSGGGQYNPNNPNLSAEARARRAAIKSVRVSLIGMSATRDAAYQNPDEATTSPARNYRTYKLESLVVPRNLGKMGAREQQETAPGEPALLSVCAGWCGGVKITWSAPTATGDTGDVDQYIVIYDTVTPPVRYQKQVGPVTSAFIDGLDPTQRWYFTVAAVNSFGTTPAMTGSPAVPEVLPASGPGIDVRNNTDPEAPSDLLISGGDVTGSPAEEPNQVTLSWTNPVDNIDPRDKQTCYLIGGGTSIPTDPVDVLAGELLRYEVLRGRTANFNPANPAEYTVVGVTTPNVFTPGLVTSTLVDKTAVACEDYYYRIRLLERCYPATAANNINPAVPNSPYFPLAGTNAMKGRASASAAPSTPATLIHPLAPAPQSNCGVTCEIYLTWPKVTTDTAVPQKSIAVEDYIVTRRQMKGTNPGPDPVRTFAVVDTTPGVGQWVTTGTGNEYWLDPSSPPSVDPDGTPYQYIYTVRAVLSCPTPFESGESSEVRYPCAFAGSGLTVSANPVQSGDGSSPANAWETTSSGTTIIRATGTNIASIQVLLASLSGGSVVNLGTQSGSGPYDFPVSGTSDGELYRVYVIARDANGCLDIAIRYLEEGTASGCCLAAQANDPLVVQYSPNSSSIDVFLKNQCANDLIVQPNGINIVWSTAAPTPSGTQLRNIEYPHQNGTGRVTQVVNNSSGTLSVTLPANAANPITPGSTYRIQLQFNSILPNATAPLTNFCVTYVRDGVEVSGQNCRIVPQPPLANPDLCN